MNECSVTTSTPTDLAYNQNFSLITMIKIQVSNNILLPITPAPRTHTIHTTHAFQKLKLTETGRRASVVKFGGYRVIHGNKEQEEQQKQTWSWSTSSSSSLSTSRPGFDHSHPRHFAVNCDGSAGIPRCVHFCGVLFVCLFWVEVRVSFTSNLYYDAQTC